MPRIDLLQIRRGSTAEWAAADPVLGDGEPGFDEDSLEFKIGNGTDPWSALSSISDIGTPSGPAGGALGGTYPNPTLSTAKQAEIDAKAPITKAVNAQTGTSYALVLGDAGGWVTLTNAAAITLTIPTNASVAFPVGTVIDFSAEGAGQVTITPVGGVTVNNRGTRTKSNGQFAVFGIIKTATNVWTSYGDLTT